jgi:hypothetical protein
MKNSKEWIKLMLPIAVSVVIGVVTQSQFVEGLATLAGVVFLVPVFVEYLKEKFDLSGKKWLFGWAASRWVSWGLSIGLVVLSWAVGFGFETMGIWKALVYGVAVGLVSNGYFTLEQIQLILAIVFEREDKVNRINEIIALKKK